MLGAFDGRIGEFLDTYSHGICPWLDVVDRNLGIPTKEFG
jgi:hypothetical protein